MQSTEPVPKTRPRLQLSATQLIASALAAVTTTIAASFLGINGTVIGAAVASVLTVAGNAIYSHSIHRTRERVRTAVPAVTWRSVGTAPTELLPDQPQPWQQPAATTTASATATTSAAGATPGWSDATTAQRPRHRRLRRLGFATVGVFVAILAALTSAELVAGRPISDLLQGKSSSGTSVTSVLGSQSGSRSSSPGTSSPTPVTTVTQTVVPKVVTATPTVTQTAPAVTVTPAATTTRTAAPTTPASPAATPTAPASASPTGSTTP
jgi:hypothetical protein